ncbi:hypothetical protein A4H97_08840 [Niastella yeongjuensis]|uniref:TonB C-terminal domain-containing protein n=1 Tax=Niastella yeongjuensis TaxID=354355 RepID=A0A1V9EEH9_9BACT|nr:hypothetical protein [Niastella yeongjuensis]OQP44472.1 hypothetical protein A4H97_08840 [Niastella yeongjuensis]SEO86475.1 hypothetical protein SAMN05660816_03778 [Niastella yeongjuensis]
MNPVTYFALLLFSFSWHTPTPSVKMGNDPQPAQECKSHFDETLKETVYTGVEKEPEYPGGAPAWGRYINRNLNEANLDPAQDCKVKIKMIVDAAGQIKKAVAIHGDTEVKEPNANEKEVLRVYLKSGFWTPGTCGGNKVTTEFVQSFTPCIK